MQLNEMEVILLEIISSAGNKLSGLSACIVRLAFIFVCCSSGASSFLLPGGYLAWIPGWVLSEQLMQKWFVRAPVPLVLTWCQSVLSAWELRHWGPQVPQLLTKENAWSECWLLC